MKKKTLYVDMDGVLIDFKSGINQLSEKTKLEYDNRLDEVPGIFSLMKPIKNGIEVITELSSYYDIYILSTAPWNNPSAWTDKLLWIHKYLPKIGYKRLILSHHKNLNKGDYLIDDRKANGVLKFEGNHIYFGKGVYSDWIKVYKFLLLEIGSVKIDKENPAELINKIKNNLATTNPLYNLYKHILESVVLQYSVDLSNKEHKILQLKAKKGFNTGVVYYDTKSEFQFTSHIISFVRDEILNYLSKRDGFKRLPKSGFNNLNKDLRKGIESADNKK